MIAAPRHNRTWQHRGHQGSPGERRLDQQQLSPAACAPALGALEMRRSRYVARI